MFASLLSVVLGAQASSAGINAESGVYTVDLPARHWHLAGRVPGPVTDVRESDGGDRFLHYHDLCFTWNQGGPVRGTIRLYNTEGTAWFRLQYLAAQTGNGVVFPNFTKFPTILRGMSFEDEAFSAPVKELAQTSTPWLLFDESSQAAIFSPASQFLVAKMVGDGRSSIGAGLNVRLNGVPAGLDQDSLLVVDRGANTAWAAWGADLRQLYRRPETNYEADILLRNFGYWTDNGADYYYNYDRDLGYANTLLAVKKRYDAEQIPLSYLQLDSWWYSKTLNDAAGRPGKTKNSKLPEGSWNRYGGLLEYKAHPDLFAKGLDGFQEELGLPLAVHNRWIDRTSPYHDHYTISGVGATDPKWWTDIVSYLKQGGVTTYEQDWLSEIYANSPEMASKVGVADAFADGMANAASRAGLTMQYCMATPRFFLQGVKYPTLTTIRTSGDRFEPRKWADFLYVSQFADAVGIAPWCDVFKSSETGNMILSVLSCGPVGTGDALGKEDVGNIHRAVRADGVIVKPDRPLLPTDETWQHFFDAKDVPSAFVASTCTEHWAVKTAYVFTFPRNKATESRFTPRSVGVVGRSYLFDLTTQSGRLVEPDEEIRKPYTGGNYAYFMLAPETACGITVLGDLQQFVPTGKQRIAEVRVDGKGLRITVHFAKSEKKVVLTGLSAYAPALRLLKAASSAVTYDVSAQRFSLEVRPPAPGQDAVVWIGR